MHGIFQYFTNQNIVEEDINAIRNHVDEIFENSNTNSSNCSSIYTEDNEQSNAETLLPRVTHASLQHIRVRFENGSNRIQSMGPESSVLGDENTIIVGKVSTLHIVSKTWAWIVIMLITYVVCLAVFPSIIALVESTNKGQVNTCLLYTSDAADE